MHTRRKVLDKCSQQSEEWHYSQILCTQPAICYVVNTDFFPPWSKEKWIAKRSTNLFSYCPDLRRVPGWRRTAVGEGWPTCCLLHLPCLAAQSLWQNRPAGTLGKHWKPLTGTLQAPQPKKYWKKSFTLPNTWLFFLFPNWNVSTLIKDEPQSQMGTLVRQVCKGGWVALQTNTLF